MKSYPSLEDLTRNHSKAFQIQDSQLNLLDSDLFIERALDDLVYQAVFNPDQKVRGTARWIIKKAAILFKSVSSSIQKLYEAMGEGRESGYTVPAINIRGMTYDVARALIRAARKNRSGTFIFEIAKSEIGYTRQNPGEYAVVILAAAIRERYQGPVFIQGDHFQANAKKYSENPEKEITGLKTLIKEAIEAGFYNIDIDTSTLVHLDKPTVKEQQKLNFVHAAELSDTIRSLEPHGITISIGGEIGEVGGQNSTVEELVAYMDNYLDVLHNRFNRKTGISKISVQTGTTHGGVPLSDGSIAKVKLDFETLKTLSKTSREKYKISGAVQHGASTLPDEAFDRFPGTGTSEIHLATGFQNLMYDHPRFPGSLREEIYNHLRKNLSDEKKQNETDEQFIYKTRKKGFGFFKEEIWTLPEEVRKTIGQSLEEKFDFLFKKLKAVHNDDRVRQLVPQVALEPTLESEIARA
ncbi:MAG TPA: class II fructose-bisphosphate aldolase [Nitrospiria bacterium]|nr:class II fructose-bisphosphate aldolase [Nitrospiria bacterium]